MGSETQIPVLIWHGVMFILTAPYAQLEPYIIRVVFIVALACILRSWIRKQFK